MTLDTSSFHTVFTSSFFYITSYSLPLLRDPLIVDATTYLFRTGM